jgi:hypothetical protein
MFLSTFYFSGCKLWFCLQAKRLMNKCPVVALFVPFFL